MLIGFTLCGFRLDRRENKLRSRTAQKNHNEECAFQCQRSKTESTRDTPLVEWVQRAE